MQTVKTILVFVLSGVSMIFSAFAFKTLWLWFIVPLGVPALSVAWAFGICTMVRFVTRHTYTDEQIEQLANEWRAIFDGDFLNYRAEKEAAEEFDFIKSMAGIAVQFAHVALGLGIGFLAKLAMG